MERLEQVNAQAAAKEEITVKVSRKRSGRWTWEVRVPGLHMAPDKDFATEWEAQDAMHRAVRRNFLYLPKRDVEAEAERKARWESTSTCPRSRFAGSHMHSTIWLLGEPCVWCCDNSAQAGLVAGIVH